MRERYVASYLYGYKNLEVLEIWDYFLENILHVEELPMPTTWSVVVTQILSCSKIFSICSGLMLIKITQHMLLKLRSFILGLI